MNRSPVERLLPQLVQMIRAGGTARWIAIAIVVTAVGLLLYRPELVSNAPSTSQRPEPSVTAPATSTETSTPSARDSARGPSSAEVLPPDDTEAVSDEPTEPAQASRRDTQPRDPTDSSASAAASRGAARRPPTAVSSTSSSRNDRVARNPSSTTTSSNGQLTPGPSGSFISPAGLIYTRGSEQGHRLKHVLVHAHDEPNRPGAHGVFGVSDQDAVIALLDEAYQRAEKGGQGVRREEDDGRTVLTIDMGRDIGYVGGQSGNRRGKPRTRHVRLVLEDQRVITAYPLIP